jgi:hypothetical protein
LQKNSDIRSNSPEIPAIFHRPAIAFFLIFHENYLFRAEKYLKSWENKALSCFHGQETVKYADLIRDLGQFDGENGSF